MATLSLRTDAHLLIESDRPDAQIEQAMASESTAAEKLHLVGDQSFDKREPDAEDSSTRTTTSILDLPPEILGTILDHLLGHMAPVSAIHSSTTPQLSKGIASVMRHPRRKALSDIALVSRAWRQPVQERIYRHIKLKGTVSGLLDSMEWFQKCQHLAEYVRHIEVWIPVWGDRTAVVARPEEDAHMGRNIQAARQFDGGIITPDILAGTLAFKLSAFNATLSEIFHHVGAFFPRARIFTLEGGHCKKSKLVDTFAAWQRLGTLEALPGIRTFVMKGTWNLMREPSRWRLFEHALPNLQEWHCAYARPQFEAYATMNDIISNYALSNIRHLNINLEGFYSKDPTLTSSHATHRAPFHLCHELGKITARLESIVFGGKVCSAFFMTALNVARRPGITPNLTSVDLGVKNCCRPRSHSGEDTGDSVVGDSATITSSSFITAFDNMVTAATFSLSCFPHLNYLRIRFIDLDSACPLLNPYFQMAGGKCNGLWNEEILEILSQFRPGVYYEELDEGIYAQARKGETALAAIYPRTRPKSIKTSSYRLLTDTRM
ncbi:hypothetical protein UCRPC4_g05178 [Phaeomoniella chlamydospora]|uniref:Uncharacterized protein n=1 Tax=Phaeomoniella chlamydospora TaxID=158046 RepID=A0A0G2GM89_PHACM|nr:hypothetical protein UCRPC4_g05178 [Phaeomoniella chlamydospora]